MLVRVLGDVGLVADDGSAVPLPGTRQPALLAALTARAGEVVSNDRLVTLLWEDNLPENPEPALHSTVFKLRSRLREAGGRDVLLTRERGYQLALSPGELDADRFGDLVREARDQPPEQAAETLACALGLWHGPAYAALADTDVARLEALRLEELRRTAVERLADALCACGRAAEVVQLLEPFVADQPLREAARSTLMRALHAQGRTADALEQYQSYRRHLAEDLGLEPSGAMQALQVELLQPPEVPSAGGIAEPPRPPVPRGGLPELQVRYVRTDAGNVLAYGSTGSPPRSGPPLVVLLGWVSSLDLIASGRDPRSSLLERLTNEVTLTTYDRAGSGLSPGPVTDHSLAASVDELSEIVRAVGPPVALMAMSAAGPIAVAFAAHRPEWVTSLVLFGTFADGPGTFTDKALRDMFVEIARSHWGLGSKMLADLYRPGASDQAAWHLARVFRDSASAEVAAAFLEAMYDYDVTDLLPSVAAPTLVLHYRGDRLIPFRGGQQLVAGIPDATMIPLDGRVHLADAADLDHVERLVAEHVHRHGPGAGSR